MIININEIVPCSDVSKKYTECRNKANKYGKIIILKNNEPDMILMSISEYEKITKERIR